MKRYKYTALFGYTAKSATAFFQGSQLRTFCFEVEDECTDISERWNDEIQVIKSDISRSEGCKSVIVTNISILSQIETDIPSSDGFPPVGETLYPIGSPIGGFETRPCCPPEGLSEGDWGVAMCRYDPVIQWGEEISCQVWNRIYSIALAQK